MSKTIIRIEHNCGNGLWRAANINRSYYRELSFYDELIKKHKNFPLPCEEGLSIQEDDYCAFKTIEQLQKWIEPEWFEEIIKLGFKIWMIDVSDYKESCHQILYRKINITSKKDITELFINK